MSEEFDGTNIYRLNNDLTYGTVDALGIYTAIGTFSGVAGNPTALAYDHVNSTMYVCVLNDSSLPQLCTADMTTGILTLVGTGIVGDIFGMDFANDGMIYGVSLEDNLYKIDPATGVLTLVGSLGIDINFGQDVSYDFETNRLYTITSGVDYQFEFGYYNISTGAFNFISDKGGDQYATFVITKTPVGPLPVTLLPENLATDVAIDATVSATFNGNVYSADLSGILITPDPGNVSASIVDNILTIAHDDFGYSTEYTVIVPMTSINDGSDDLGFDLEWSFTTECVVATNLNEDFETAVPPICWETYQVGLGTRVWGQSNACPNSGIYSASAGNESSTDENQQWLVTRDITVPINHKLTFYATDSLTIDYASTLNVKVSIDDGAIYTDLLIIAEADVSDWIYSYFWIDVSAYSGQNVKFAFVMIDSNGDTWFLDDVKLEVLTDIEINSSSSVSIYPNPSTGFVNITSTENSEVKILDITGRIIEAFTLNAFESVNFVQPAGMYIVQVESNGKVSTHKLLIK
jgi:hypothetical protein